MSITSDQRDDRSLLDVGDARLGRRLSPEENPDRGSVFASRRPRGLDAWRISVVVPTFNEAANLPHVLPRIPEWVEEVIIVDGHSIDDTVDIAKSLWPSAQVIFQERRGKGNALACGFEAARGDIIVMLDADGSTDPEEIPRFLEPLLDGADFVKGSRRLEGGGSSDISRARELGNRALTRIVNAVYKTRYTDLCYGYNAFWSRCLPHIEIDSDGFEVEALIHARVARAGLKVCEVPSMEHARIHGESNLRTIRDGWRVLRAIFAERPGRSAGRERCTQCPPYPLVADSPPYALVTESPAPSSNQ